MKQENIEKYSRCIYMAAARGTAPNLIKEIKKAEADLEKILKELPLEIEPHGNEAKITYYPDGGSGSAAIGDLIRVGSTEGIRLVKLSNGKNAKELKFSYFGKALAFEYKKYTIEIDTRGVK